MPHQSGPGSAAAAAAAVGGGGGVGVATSSSSSLSANNHHHQQHQQHPSAAAVATMNTYSPPRMDGAAAAAIMRHNNTNHPSSLHHHHYHHDGGHHLHNHHSSTLVTPVVSAKPWVGVGSNNSDGGGDGRGGGITTTASTLLPGKSTDSTDARSTGSSMHGGDDGGGGTTGGSGNSYASSAPTLATEPLSSMDERDGAANALLGLLSTTATAKGTRSTSPSSIPFKKRLVVDGKVQETGTTTTTTGGKGSHKDSKSNQKSSTGTEDLAACHVSPVSHSSMSDHASRTESKDDGTPPRSVVKANGGGGRQQQQQQRQQKQHAGNGVSTVSANRTSSYDSKDYLRGGNTNTNKEALSHQSTTHSSQRTLELLAESKVYNASQIGQMRGATPAAMAATTPAAAAAGTTVAAPPRMVPHFPAVLHQVLSDPQLTNVVQWLPEGESWKVVNWTALRRTVLPKYFHDLRDENGTVASAGTIDAFLYHLGAWGFEEVKETSKTATTTAAASVGAYRHELFIRGAQKLCARMRFTADLTDTHQGPKTVSPTRSSLQVPTLAPQDPTNPTSDPADASQGGVLPNKRPRYESIPGVLHWPYSSSNEPWGGPHRGPQHYHSPEHLYGMRTGVSAATAAAMVGPYGTAGSSYPPELQFRRYSMESVMLSGHPPASDPGAPHHQRHSPPQVRSARGGLRLPANRAGAPSATISPSTLSVIRQNFPVSNRGKGPRKPAPVRNSATPKSETKEGTSTPTSVAERSSFAETTVAVTTLSEAQRIGSQVQDVAVAISRKTSIGTKRKLPLTPSIRKALDVTEAVAPIVTACEKTTTLNLSREDGEEKKED